MTTLPPLASTEDLATHLGEAIGDDQGPRAAYLLRVASARARRRCGQSWLSDDATSVVGVPDEVAAVVLQAAGRAFLNVEGYVAEGDADYNLQRGGDRAEAGTVYFTPGEEATLDAYALGAPRRTGMWTQPTTRLDVDDPASYAETDPYLAGWPGQQ